MNTTSIEHDFLKEISKDNTDFKKMIQAISRKLDLEISNDDILETGGQGIEKIETKYPEKSITVSQFIFLTVTLAIRHHSAFCVYDENDSKCIMYLMSLSPKIKRHKDFTVARHDFYHWFIKNRPK